MTNSSGHRVAANSGPDHYTPPSDPQADERYEREIRRMNETADTVMRDSREALTEGMSDQATLDRITVAVQAYVSSTTRLLKHIYGVTGDGA